MTLPPPSKIKEWENDPEGARVLGESAKRLIGRRRAVRELLKKDPKTNRFPWSEVVGDNISTIPSSLLGAGAGAGIGYLCGLRDKRRLGAATLGGLGIGFALSGLGGLAPLMVPFQKRRTLKEQMDYENKSHWLKHCTIPGSASYDYWRGIQTSQYLAELPEKELMAQVNQLKKNASLRDYLKDENTSALRKYLTTGTTWGALTGGVTGASIGGNKLINIPVGIAAGSLAGAGLENIVDRLAGKGYGSLAVLGVGVPTVAALGYRLKKNLW